MSFRSPAMSTCKHMLVILFLYTAVSKLLNYSATALQMKTSPFITTYAHVLAWGIPLIEIVISVLLITGRTRLYGFYASLFLMMLFTGYVFAMMQFSYYLPCSCGGVLAILTWKQHLWVNIFFSIVALTGTILQKSKDERSKAFSMSWG